ncbi:fructuronate reductase [Pillotina sp. SPG140]
MHLNESYQTNPELWNGIELPQFDRNSMLEKTKDAPRWVHFGAGNIFRAFPAVLQQRLLNQGLEQAGIIVAEGYDGAIIDRVFDPYGNLTLAVTLKADGSIHKELIASVAAAYRLDKTDHKNALLRIFSQPSLQIASFTITEKGYSLTDRSGAFVPAVLHDFKNGPLAPSSYMGHITALLYERFRTTKSPITMLSMDNCSHNGDKLFTAIDTFSQTWVENKVVEAAFLDYIRDPAQVSFPWTMIDKITPRPDESVKAKLLESGFEDCETVVTDKQTYIAPFVNAEESQYLVIEDTFPNGRPKLETVGVLFTDRETVDKIEKMKVCTCLNPLHTALAIFGCLLGYTRINEEMKNPALLRLVERIGYSEGLAVVVHPGIIQPRQFLDEVIRVRLPNPFMPDTPQRIACDSSLKIPIRFGETIKAYRVRNDLNIHDLKGISLTIAAWCRYLLGVDDQLKAFTVSPDPQYESVSRTVRSLSVGQPGPFHGALKPILSDIHIFACNLYEVGIGTQIEEYFTQLMQGPGAVAATLEREVAQY